MISLSRNARQPTREAWSIDQVIHEQSITLSSILDKSTYGNYTSMLNSYILFCKLHNRPIYLTENTLSCYIVFMCCHIKPDSVDTYLSGICNQLETHFPHVQAIRSSTLISRTLKGFHDILTPAGGLTAEIKTAADPSMLGPRGLQIRTRGVKLHNIPGKHVGIWHCLSH
jgi:hypothetical protein